MKFGVPMNLQAPVLSSNKAKHLEKSSLRGISLNKIVHWEACKNCFIFFISEDLSRSVSGVTFSYRDKHRVQASNK